MTRHQNRFIIFMVLPLMIGGCVSTPNSDARSTRVLIWSESASTLEQMPWLGSLDASAGSVVVEATGRPGGPVVHLVPAGGRGTTFTRDLEQASMLITPADHQLNLAFEVQSSRRLAAAESISLTVWGMAGELCTFIVRGTGATSDVKGGIEDDLGPAWHRVSFSFEGAGATASIDGVPACHRSR
jgi:hypothetical protein